MSRVTIYISAFPDEDDARAGYKFCPTCGCLFVPDRVTPRVRAARGGCDGTDRRGAFMHFCSTECHDDWVSERDDETCSYGQALEDGFRAARASGDGTEPPYGGF